MEATQDLMGKEYRHTPTCAYTAGRRYYLLPFQPCAHPHLQALLPHLLA